MPGLFEYSRPVLLLILSLASVSECWRPHNDIKTGNRILISGGTIFTTMSVPISYNITFAGSALTQTTSCGIGIVGFNTFITNDFSVNATIVNFLVNTMRITAQAFGDTIVSYFAVNYIAVGASVDFAQVQFACFLPFFLNAGNSTRTEARTGTSLFVGKVLQTNVYLSGFQVHNSDGMINHLSAAVSSPPFTSALNYVFTTSENNTVASICYTTVIFCQNCTQDFYYNWGEIGQQLLSNTTASSSTPIKTRYNEENQMFFGMSMFNVSRSINRQWELNTTAYTDISNNYKSNYGTYNILLQYFLISVRGCNTTALQWFYVPDQTCIADNTCGSLNTTQTLPSGARFCKGCDYTCRTCAGAMYNNCTNCTPAFYRVLTGGNSCPCQPGYIDVLQQLCYPCSYYIPGCNTCHSTTLCQSCFPAFSITPAAVCQCSYGFMVTGVCTSITGCTSAVQLAGTVYCLACNSTLYYTRISNFTCTCMTGFLANALFACLPVCSDAKVVGTQTCDDGNLVNGDGCSSVCAVESNWTCDNTVTPSKCYRISNVSASLKYVRRVLSSNTAEIAIQLAPQFPSFAYMDFIKFMNTSLPCVSTSSVYRGGLLILYCSYPHTIEGGSYPVTINLDPSLFKNSQVSLVVPTSGMNAKLTYDSNYQANYPLDVIVIILDVLAVIVLFASSVTERMIGVQLIQTLQAVLFTMAVMSACPSSLSSLQYLTYANGFNGLASQDHSRVYTYDFSVSSIGVEKQFLLSFNLMLILLSGVICACLILKAILLYQSKTLRADMELESRNIQMAQLFPSHFKIRTIYKFIFERIFFLLGMMVMFSILFGTATQLNDQSASYIVLKKEFNLLFCGISIALTITLLTMVIVNGIYPQIGIFPFFMKKGYPPYYAVYTSTFIMLTAFVYTQTFIIYTLLSLTFVNILVLAVWRPYPEKIHNFTIIFNQSIVALALAIYLLEEIAPSSQNQNLYLIVQIVIICALYLAVFLAILRICRFWSYMKSQGLTYDDKIRSSQEESKQYIELLSAKEQQGDHTRKPSFSHQKPKHSFEDEYLAQMRHSQQNAPLNSRKTMYRDPLTKRKHDFDDSRLEIQTKDVEDKNVTPSQANEQDYDTFNADKTKQNINKSGDYDIERVDPRGGSAIKSGSPYDQFGNVRSESSYYTGRSQDEYDALRIIKERLRKDFYYKVHGIDYVAPNQQPNENGIMKITEQPEEEADEEGEGGA